MRRSTAAVLAAAVAAGTAVPAMASVLVTENFSTNTNSYWTHPNTTTSPQNYGWSNTDNTGSAVNPPGGTASGAGELGGTLQRSGSPPNFYGFNVGTIGINEAFQASGVIRLMSRGGSSGFYLGYFGQGDGADPIDSYGSGGNASNFVGLTFDDGYDAWVNIYDFFQNRDRSDIPTNLVDPVANGGTPGPAVPFSMIWDPAPAGSSEKGQLRVSINNSPEHIHNYTGDLNFLDFTQFGIMPVSADGGNCTVFLDDLTFSSENSLGGTPGWATDNHGDWLNAANWVGAVPNSPGAVATFGSAITADRLVYANSNITAGTINFDNAHTYLIAGLGTLTIDDPAGAHVNVLQGSHKINLPAVVASNLTINVAGGATLRVSDPVTVNSGVSVSQTGAGQVLYESTVSLGSAASIQFGNSSHMASLTLGSSAAATVTPGVNKTMVIDNVNIAAGKLDLKDNKLITQKSAGNAPGGVYNGLQGDVQTAYDFGAWDGNGLTTSMPDAVAGLTTIGIATGAQVRGLGPSDTDTFGGQQITGASTIAMYTYAGDANLDGTIDGGDYGIIDNFVQVPNADGYGNGDFNYDGVIDGGDYGIIDNNIQAQGAPFPTSGVAIASETVGLTAVPEPSACGFAILATAAMFGGRQRRRSNG